MCLLTVWTLTSICVFMSPSRMQPRLLPLPPGLCEVVPSRLHLGPAASQPLPGELGGPVLRPSLPALQPRLPHLLRHRTHRLLVLPTSQPLSPHLLPAPEPGPEEISSTCGTPGWRSPARRHSSGGGQQRRRRGAPGAQRSSVHPAARRPGRAQLCLHPGCLHRGLHPAADALRGLVPGLEDQTALCVFRDERGAGGLRVWLRPRTGEEDADMLQGDPHCVGGRGHDRLRVWIRRRGRGRSQREDSFYQDTELHLAEPGPGCHQHFDPTTWRRITGSEKNKLQALLSHQHPSNWIKEIVFFMYLFMSAD